MAETKLKDSVAFYEMASPAMLAKQPIKPTGKIFGDKISEEDWGILKQHLEGELGMLRTWRDSWWIQNYSDLSRYILPRRSIWLTQSAGGLPSPNTMTRGLEINNDILDPTATFDARICAGGLKSGLCSESRPWFKISPALNGHVIDDEGKQWLDSVEEIVYTVLARSNFYNAFAQECEDIVIYGTAVNIIYEDTKDLIRCYTPCVGEYFLGVGATQRVDTLDRVFVMNISQMVDFFGLENIGPGEQKLWEEKGGAITTERLIAHSIEPNYPVGADGKGVGVVKGDFAYREVYWVYGAGSKQPLAIRGFVESPFTASRWATQSNDAYGRSPGMDILPDVIQLQVMTERAAEGVEKGLRPPLLAHAELKNYPSSQLPGMVTYLNDMAPGKGMRSIYEQQFDLDHVQATINAIQQRIGRGLFVDLWLMLESMPDTERTKFEIQSKLQEKMSVLGPVVENLLGESLHPKLRRIFGILKRKKMIPPVPKSLQGVPLDIEFISILALAQKAANLGGLEAIVKIAGELANIGKPEALDNINGDSIMQQYNDMLGNKQTTLVDQKVVAGIRQQRAQQQAAAQKAAMLQHTAETANKGSKAAVNLSNIDVGSGNTALQQILGTGGSAGQQRL